MKLGLEDDVRHPSPPCRRRSAPPDFPMFEQAFRWETWAAPKDKIKNMGNAGRNGGEYYTPRPLIRANTFRN